MVKQQQQRSLLSRDDIAYGDGSWLVADADLVLRVPFLSVQRALMVRCEA
jgi:hypothetical protein